MHNIEPFYNWSHLYTSKADKLSPFYKKKYSEFEFSNTVYNYYVHPQWDAYGSETLYLKILYTDYESHYSIIEFIGEWNDAIEDDIMRLKANVINRLLDVGIKYFLLIGEYIFNFHSGDNDYYQEWKESVEGAGWIVLLNLPPATLLAFIENRTDRYITPMEIPNWRTFEPEHLFQLIMQKRKSSLIDIY